MSDRVVSEVSARVHPAREDEFLAAFREMVALPRPEGLLRTELLRGSHGEWRVQTLWRDLDALASTRVAPEAPRTAPQVFRGVGSEPSLEILDVELAYDSTSPTE